MFDANGSFQLFRGLFDNDLTRVISVTDFLICVGCALLVGLIYAAMYRYRTYTTRSFLITVALLPAAVCVVIMMVNGNIGAGVAVAGAFSLVRFRSAPGSAREIVAIFSAMASGLIIGMGYLAYAFLFAILIGLALMIYTRFFSGKKKKNAQKTLRVTIPEDLDYTEVFDDIFEKYTSACDLVQVRTTNMGSLFRVTYDITLKDTGAEKQMIDEIRCRNGNLEITVSNRETLNNEL